MFILANNKTKDIIKVSGMYDGLTAGQQITLRQRVLEKAVDTGILLADLEYYYIADSNNPISICQRILSGQSYNVNWTNGNITGIDFSAEDTKGYIKFETNKNSIKGDGIDTATITLTVYLADKITVKNVTVNKLVPVKIPGAVISAQMQITNGIGMLTFKKINDLPLGKYTFPLPSKYLFGFKLWEFVEVDVYLPM